jgi:hypothetical protein
VRTSPTIPSFSRPVAVLRRVEGVLARNTNAELPNGSSAILSTCVASSGAGVAEEARIRGFATPALAGCAFVEDKRVCERLKP